MVEYSKYPIERNLPDVDSVCWPLRAFDDSTPLFITDGKDFFRITGLTEKGAEGLALTFDPDPVKEHNELS